MKNTPQMGQKDRPNRHIFNLTPRHWTSGLAPAGGNTYLGMQVPKHSHERFDRWFPGVDHAYAGAGQLLVVPDKVRLFNKDIARTTSLVTA